MSKKFLDNNGLLYVWNKIVAKFQAKELKTGSTTDYKVLSDNNLTDELVGKINAASTFSGSYNDLTDKPAIPDATSDLTNDSGFITKDVADLANYTKSEDLAAVATSGKYEDLQGTPDLTVFAKDADLHAVAKSGKYADLEGTPDLTGFITKDVDNLTNYTKSADLAKVATTGAYADLAGTPDLTVFAKDADLHAVAKSGAYADLEGTPDLTVFAKSADLKAVAFSGSYNDLTDKPVIPTNNNELANGAGYQNAEQVQAIVNEAVGQITGISYEVVTELPAAGEAGVIYLMANGGANPNIYDEYIFTNGKFEKIGTTETDLTGYIHENDALTNEEIDALLGA